MSELVVIPVVESNTTVLRLTEREANADPDGRYEFIKTGQSLGDDGNWSLRVEGNNLVIKVKVSGVWKKSFAFTQPP